MQIWLTTNKKGFMLPILPPSFEVSAENGHGTVNIQTKGDMTVLGKTGLKTITISSFFPGQDYSFSAYKKDREPYEYIDELLEARESVVHLTITDTNITMDCTIQSLTYGEADASGDVSFTLSLREYRTPKRTVTMKPGGIGFKPPRPSVGGNQTHVATVKYRVKKGDTLRSISKKFYKTGAKWRKIYNANKKVIEREARRHGKKCSSRKGVKGGWIFQGTRLVIPNAFISKK